MCLYDEHFGPHKTCCSCVCDYYLSKPQMYSITVKRMGKRMYWRIVRVFMSLHCCHWFVIRPITIRVAFSNCLILVSILSARREVNRLLKSYIPTRRCKRFNFFLCWRVWYDTNFSLLLYSLPQNQCHFLHKLWWELLLEFIAHRGLIVTSNHDDCIEGLDDV